MTFKNIHMYKTTIFFLLMLISFGTIAQSVNPSDRQEKIESLKRAFIAEKLDLTVEEAEKFWPVFNEYSKDKKANKKQLKDLMESVQSSTPNKAALEESINKGSDLRIAEVQRDEKFLTDCLEILSPDKVRKLITIEHEFRKKLMEKLRERKESGEQRRPGGRGRD